MGKYFNKYWNEDKYFYTISILVTAIFVIGLVFVTSYYYSEDYEGNVTLINYKFNTIKIDNQIYETICDNISIKDISIGDTMRIIIDKKWPFPETRLCYVVK